MERFRTAIVAAVALAVCGVGAAEVVWDEDYKKPNLPDVDKPHTVKPDGTWSINQGYENTCAQASTANMLWAAGYRKKPDGTDAASAADLYAGIVASSGNVMWTLAVEKNWLDNYFQNNQAEKGNPYKAITLGGGDGIENVDRDKLFEQLKRCQYIELAIQAVSEDRVGHAVTLSGFRKKKKADGSTELSEIYIQDSDRDKDGDGTYDVYTNKNEGDDCYWCISNYRFVKTDGTILIDDACVQAYKMICPEPATLALLAMGGAAVLIRRRRRHLPGPT